MSLIVNTGEIAVVGDAYGAYHILNLASQITPTRCPARVAAGIAHE
jgi:hypothetical protein